MLIDIDILDDDKDLYTVLCFSLEEVVKSISLISWSSKVEFG